MNKKPVFHYPSLEKQIEENRALAVNAATQIIKKGKSYRKSSKFAETPNEEFLKNTCLSEAREFKVLTDDDVYLEMNIKPNNGTTIVRAFFEGGNLVSTHYHGHQESIKIIEGEVEVEINKTTVKLFPESFMAIPANVLHSMEVPVDTEVLACVPTSIIKNLLAPGV